MPAEAKVIKYPYLPPGRIIEYVPSHDRWMTYAMQTAREQSLDKTMPGGAVIVMPGTGAIPPVGNSEEPSPFTEDRFLGRGANGSAYHETNGCERVKRGCKSGEGYDLCEGCSPVNHSEAKAIDDAFLAGIRSIAGCNLYLWGHWWCCQDCWGKMEITGVKRVFLLEGSERLFDKNHPDNIVGRQFAAT